VRDELRTRAALDLHCSAAQVTVSETGMGGWRAVGCGQIAAYTCARSVCALERLEGHRVAEGGRYTIGPWDCDVTSTSEAEADRISEVLFERHPALSACAARQLVLAPNPEHGLAILAVDEDRPCVEAALAPAQVFVHDSPTIRCGRR
jgi:hypothetical protein